MRSSASVFNEVSADSRCLSGRRQPDAISVAVEQLEPELSRSIPIRLPTKPTLNPSLPISCAGIRRPCRPFPLDTELGRIGVEPQEIAVIPRGLRFQVDAPDRGARGYICENFGAPFKLPDLGIIGSNGLANPRDFLTPHAY